MRARRVVRREATRCARRSWGGRARLSTENTRQLVDADGARSQQPGLSAGAIDNGRFDAVTARAAIQDDRDFAAELIFNVLRGRCADAAEAVRRRGGDAVAAALHECAQQRMSDGVCRYAQSDALLTARDRVADAFAARQNKGQRARPERVSQQRRVRG